jgi:hypothetical protein
LRIGDGKFAQRFADAAPSIVDRLFRGLSQPYFELGKQLFNREQIKDVMTK